MIHNIEKEHNTFRFEYLKPQQTHCRKIYKFALLHNAFLIFKQIVVANFAVVIHEYLHYHLITLIFFIESSWQRNFHFFWKMWLLEVSRFWLLSRNWINPVINSLSDQQILTLSDPIWLKVSAKLSFPSRMRKFWMGQNKFWQWFPD